MGVNQERPKVKIGRDPFGIPIVCQESSVQLFLRVALIIYKVTREAHWLK